MHSTNLIEAMKHSENIFFKVQDAHSIYLDRVSELNTKCYNDLCAGLTKNINDDILNTDAGLKEVVDVLIGVYSDTKEELIFVKAKLYFIDGEKYRLIGDQRSHNYFKRRCTEEFRKIKTLN